MNQMKSSDMLGFGAVLSVLAVASSPVLSAPRDAVYQPKAGSAERKAIFNALRVPVGRSLKHAVIFQGTLKASKSGWAFFSGGALLDDGKNGKPISNEGSGGEMAALLRHSGGRWRVLSWGFGGGMDEIESEKRKYPQAPRALFHSHD